MRKLNCLSMWRPELALRLNGKVVVATVVLLNMEVKHSLVVKTFAAETHQRRQTEVVQQRVKYQPCHRHEVLVTGLTLLEEIHCLHGPVSDVLTPMSVLEPIGTDFATIQADQVEGTLSVHVLVRVCKITPHPRKEQCKNLSCWT